MTWRVSGSAVVEVALKGLFFGRHQALLAERARVRRGDEPTAGPYEELVARGFAQTRERSAHG